MTGYGEEKKRIIDEPYADLKRSMAEYGEKHSSSVRSSRKYLRSIGVKIKNDRIVY